MHLSTAAQALETARLYFADAPSVLALEISFAAVANNILFELAPKRGEQFPHLYAPLKRKHVMRAVRLEKRDGVFRFGEAL